MGAFGKGFVKVRMLYSEGASAPYRPLTAVSVRPFTPASLPNLRLFVFGFALQGTDEEELERVMEVSGMRDADVWAPLTGDGDPNLYDSEEEEMGGASVFFVGGHEEKSRVVGRSAGISTAGMGVGGGGGRQVGKRAPGSGGGGISMVAVHSAKSGVL